MTVQQRQRLRLSRCQECLGTGVRWKGIFDWVWKVLRSQKGSFVCEWVDDSVSCGFFSLGGQM